MEVHHLALRTADSERLEAYYRAVFDLPVVRRQPGRSVWLGLGAAVLMIETQGPDEPAVPAGCLELLALRVTPEDKEQTQRRLEAVGCTIEDATEHTLYFRDPDGRRVAVSSYPLPKPEPLGSKGD